MYQVYLLYIYYSFHSFITCQLGIIIDFLVDKWMHWSRNIQKRKNLVKNTKQSVFIINKKKIKKKSKKHI